VLVKDEGGPAIPLAHVIVYQEHQNLSTLVVRPPDFQDNTNTHGFVRFPIKVPAGESLKLAIEVSAENFVGIKEDVDLGTQFQAQVLKQFFLKPKTGTQEKPAETTTIKVHVERKTGGESVEGARVTVFSLGGITTNQFNGQTDDKGNADIVTPLNMNST